MTDNKRTWWSSWGAAILLPAAFGILVAAVAAFDIATSDMTKEARLALITDLLLGGGMIGFAAIAITGAVVGLGRGMRG